MVEGKQRNDSSRDLLEELEDGWATPPPAQATASGKEPRMPSASEMEDLDKLAASVDEGWLDDLFPEEEDDEDEEEPEPELPDERADPVAFAAAKKAREERSAKRKEKKKVKLEAKRARQRAKLQAMRQKQKSKKGRAAGSGPKSERGGAAKKSVAPASKRSKDAAAPESLAGTSSDIDATSEEEVVEEVVVKRSRSPKANAATVKRASTIQSIKLLAIVLAVLLALAALVAALAK